MLALLVRLVYNMCVSKKEAKEYPMKMQVGNLVQVKPSRHQLPDEPYNGKMGIVVDADLHRFGVRVKFFDGSEAYCAAHVLEVK